MGLKLMKPMIKIIRRTNKYIISLYKNIEYNNAKYKNIIKL